MNSGASLRDASRRDVVTRGLPWALVLAVALAIRLSRLGHFSYWLDEVLETYAIRSALERDLGFSPRAGPAGAARLRDPEGVRSLRSGRGRAAGSRRDLGRGLCRRIRILFHAKGRAPGGPGVRGDPRARAVSRAVFAGGAALFSRPLSPRPLAALPRGVSRRSRSMAPRRSRARLPGNSVRSVPGGARSLPGRRFSGALRRLRSRRETPRIGPAFPQVEPGLRRRRGGRISAVVARSPSGLRSAAGFRPARAVRSRAHHAMVRLLRVSRPRRLESRRGGASLRAPRRRRGNRGVAAAPSALRARLVLRRGSRRSRFSSVATRSSTRSSTGFRRDSA